MDVVNIFTTATQIAATGDFVHGSQRFVFDHLGCDGPQRLVEGPVWAFIDWVMPEMSGLEMCRRLRSDPRMDHAHVTMILEQDDAGDRRRALRAGADDYMIGPVDRNDLLDRVLALQARRQNYHAANIVERGDLVIDLGALQARWDGTPVDLRPNEFRLLRYFAENPNRVFSRAQLIGGLGKQEPPIDERTVDVWVGRLRRALKCAGAGDPLRTVRSMGYVFDMP